MHIVLIGDSIFDNASYVGEAESVENLLSNQNPDAEVSLLAVDGAYTIDVHEQLKSFPDTATNVFVSCGGNDALRSIDTLEVKSSSVGESLDILFQVKEKFRENYVSMLEGVLSKHDCVAVCTIYNKVPDLSERSYTALALFNEVILEELASRNLPVIDLRVICNEARDYSPISSIEPSVHGGKKIVSRIGAIVENGCLSGIYV